MEPKQILTADRPKTPRVAAVAGIVFSVLFLVSLLLTCTPVPADLRDGVFPLWVLLISMSMLLPNLKTVPASRG